MATVVWLRIGAFGLVRCSIDAVPKWTTAALYHLGGICTIIVIRDNGMVDKAAYHGAFPQF
jgi:hypothetical protein